MPWAYIMNVLGPGVLWNKTQEEFQNAIARAERDGQKAAAEHMRILLANRNAVRYEKETPPRSGV